MTITQKEKEIVASIAKLQEELAGLNGIDTTATDVEFTCTTETGYTPEMDPINIDIMSELNMLRYASGIDWTHSLEFTDGKILFDKYEIVVKRAKAGKLDLVLTNDSCEDIILKGQDKTVVLIKWIENVGTDITVLSEGDWTMLAFTIDDIVLEASFKDNFCSLKIHNSKKNYYDNQWKLCNRPSLFLEDRINKYISARINKNESAFNQVDTFAMTESDRVLVMEAINVLEEYHIDCTQLNLQEAF